MEPMTIDERRKYLSRMAPRYWQADRPEQSRLLDEMEAMTGLHRKSLLQLLRPDGLVRHPRVQQRGREYGPAVDDALRMIWESLDYVCAERLTPGLVPTAPLLAQHGELRLTPELESQLGPSSVATVPRPLTRLAQDTPAPPAQRARASEPGGAGDPDAADSLGRDGARALRGRFGASQRAVHRRGVSPHAPARRRGDGLE